MDIGEAKLVPVCTLEGHKDRVWHAEFSRNGRLVATCGGDKTVRIWQQQVDPTIKDKKVSSETVDLKSKWHCIAILEDTHTRTIRRVTWSHCGTYLVACSFDATASVWRKSVNDDGNIDFECFARLEGHENEVKAVALHSSGSLLATCSRDKSVWIWEMEEEDFECISVLHGHAGDVKAVQWHPFEEILASASYDDTVKLWAEEEDDWYCRQTLKGHESTVWDLAFHPSGTRLASCGADLAVIIWGVSSSGENAGKWKMLHRLTGHHIRCMYSIDWSATSDVLQFVTGSGDNSIRVFSKREGEKEEYDALCKVEQAHGEDINCVRWNPTNNLIVSCSDDTLVKMWYLQSS